MEKGIRIIREIFQAPAGVRPDALVAHMDYWAFLSIQVIRDLGLQVPSDVPMVGSFNTPWSQAGAIPISTVDMCVEEVARLAVEKLAGASWKTESLTVEPRLVVRASSALSVGVVHEYLQNIPAYMEDLR